MTTTPTTHPPVANHAALRAEVCRIGRSLFERGYAHATAGNISVRLPEGQGFLITPTDACLGFLDPAKLARLDNAGQQLAGDRASKTIMLHSAIHRAARTFDAHARCVIHTHSTHCVVLSLVRHEPELLPAITPYFVMKVGRVPVIPYRRPGSPEAVELVRDAIQRYGVEGRPLRAVMLARLGPVVWHDSPGAAMAVLEELEETARLVASATDAVEPLTETQIQELRDAFGARW